MNFEMPQEIFVQIAFSVKEGLVNGYVFKGWIDEQTLVAARPGSGIVVAVKKLKPEGFQGQKEWLVEGNYLSQLHHPHLVKLIRYSLEGENRLLVYEFMPKGSLEKHLFRRRLTVKYDVYGFGVVLLELLSGRCALDQSKIGAEQNLIDWAKPYLSEHKLYRVMDMQLEGKYPQKGAQAAAALAMRCIHSDAKARPQMTKVLDPVMQRSSKAWKHRAPWSL
ncbi:kinase 2B protein [Nymphaea thermarum]|nr:kinase 2B protein [Nymphaea thermarum]